MNRVKKVAGMLAALLLSTAQMSCGAQSEATPDPSAAAALLDKLVVDITGDLEELKSAELLNYQRVEGGIEACMREAGHTYKPLPFVSFYDAFTEADLGYGDGRATVVDSPTTLGRRIVLSELATARLKRAGALERRVSPAELPALHTCSAMFQSRGYHDFDPPAGVAELVGLDGLLGPVQRDPAVVSAMAGYPDCMKQRYGFTVTDRGDFLSSPRINSAHAPLPGRRASPKWRTGLLAVNKAFKADADCRGPAYRAAMPLLAERIGPWRADNRDKLFAVRAGWRKVVTDARKLRS